MAEHGNGYKHSDSDRKLDQAAQAADTRVDPEGSSGPGHNAAEVRKHDDTGKDRLFEAREQHDPAEKASEKSRLAKDVARHDHSDADLTGDSASDGGEP